MERRSFARIVGLDSQDTPAARDLFHESRAGGGGLEYNRADMTPENAPAVEPEPAGMSEFSRLTGVFFEPGKTFADIAERPRWLVPLVLRIGFGVLFCVGVGQRVGWDTVAQQQLDQRMAKMKPEQREVTAKSADISKKLTPVIAYTFAVIGPPIGYLISAAVLLGIVAGVMSAPVKFAQVLRS